MKHRRAVRIVIALLVVAGLTTPWSTVRPAGAALRPLVEGRSGAISAGDPRTTSAGFQILLRGGNAIDAGVAALLAAGVVEQDLFSLGGEGLILVYDQRTRKVTSINGQGWAAAKATIDWYLERGKDLNGEGLDPSVIPGALHAALTTLERWGTMSFEEVVGPALDYAENGFVLRPRTANSIRSNLEFFKKWPDNQRYWLKPDGSMYKPGEIIKLPDTAATIKKMIEAERTGKFQGREKGIAAARDRFYKGDIANEMVAFLKKRDTPYEYGDFAEYFARVEEPAMTSYKGYQVYKHGVNSQGPVLLQTLNILENFDLVSMKHDSAEYIHTLVEAMKLAYADRDTYYADPAFVKVPAKGLLSKEYAAARAKTINPEKSFTGFMAGDPTAYDPDVKTWAYWKANMAGNAAVPAPDAVLAAVGQKDTTHIAVIDRWGNIFDSTPSGGWIGGAVILGKTGIGMSVRGEQFWLDKTKAAQLRPRSRPRYTLTPSIVLWGNQPFMAIGTPGGDNQDQTILQTFLAITEFWSDWYPNLHAAIEAPRVLTLHFYNSFWPHTAGFNRLQIESNIPDDVFRALQARGHNVSKVPVFGVSGCSTVVLRDPSTGHLLAGADPRRECYAMGY